MIKICNFYQIIFIIIIIVFITFCSVVSTSSYINYDDDLKDSGSVSSGSVSSGSDSSDSFGSFSDNDGSDSKEFINNCNQLDESFFVKIKNGNFEHRYEGWNGNAEEVIFFTDLDVDTRVINVFEGLGAAAFYMDTTNISSNPTQFPNYSNPIISNLFKTMNLEITFKISLVPFNSSSGSSDSSNSDSFSLDSSDSFSDSFSGSYDSYDSDFSSGFSGGNSGSFSNSFFTGSNSFTTGGSGLNSEDNSESLNNQQQEYSKLDLKNIKSNVYNNNKKNNNNNNEASYLEIFIDDISVLNISTEYFNPSDLFSTIAIDIAQFLDGNNHTLLFKYQLIQYSHDGFFQIIYIDNINFIPIPYNYIENDIYISINGDDFIGDGSKNNSFCSIQRAIYSLKDGYSLYLIDKKFLLIPVFKEQAYLMDTIGKKFSLIGLDSFTEIQVSVNTSLGTNLLLCDNSQVCQMSSIFFRQSLSLDTIIVSENSQFFFIDSVFEASVNETNSLYFGVIFTPSNSNLTVANSRFNSCGSTCFYSGAEEIIIQGTTFVSDNSFVLTTFSNQSRIYISQIYMISDNSHGILVQGTAFDSLIIDNLVFFDIKGMGIGLSLSNGNLIELRNFSINGLSISFEIRNVLTVLISDVNLINFNGGIAFVEFQRPFLSTKNVAEIYLNNLFISGGTESEQPYVISSISEKIIIENLYYGNNPVPFINANGVKNFTVNNAMIQENSKQFTFFITNSIFYIYNTVLDNSPNQFLSSSKSMALLRNITFSNNQNLNTNLVEPIIYLSQMKTVIIDNLHAYRNLNFELIKMVGCHNVRVKDSTVENQMLGNMFIIENSTFSLENSQVLDSFLATDYPFHSTNSNLTIKDCIFYNNTQYFFIQGGQFSFDNCSFENIITVNDDSSYFISKSKGVFNSVFIGSTHPHLGLVIKDSTIEHYGCLYSNISSYNNTIGLYIDSNITFYDCQFIDNTAASSMMTFERGTTVFNYCIFDSLSSLQVSILRSSDQTFLYFNSSIIRNCQSNGNGVEATNSYALFENSIVSDNYYLQGNLFTMISSNITFCNITHTGNQANYNVINGYVFIELFYVSDCYFPDALLKIQGGSALIRESIIEENTGHSIIIVYDSKLDLSNSTFNNNELLDSFVYSDTSTVYVYNIAFDKNLSTRNGSCFSAIAESKIYLTLSNFTFNEAIIGGVGTLSLGSYISIDSCQFINNTALNDGSFSGPDGCGACFFIEDAASSIDVYNSLFIGNNATHRGGVFYVSNNGMNDTVQVNITGSTFIGNSAEFGPGGVCFTELSAGCQSDSTTQFSGNTATYGEQYASSVKSFSILPLENGAHSHTTTTVGLSLFDYYGQSMVFLDFLANFTLAIYNQSSNEPMIFESIYLEYQGFVQIEITFPFMMIGDIITLVANASLEEEFVFEPFYTFEMNVTVSPCSIGYQFGPSNNCTACPIGNYGYNGIDCYECDGTQAICPGKSTIYPQSGYWVLLEDLKPPKVYPCDPAYCLVRQCRPGQSGTLCSICDPGYSKVKMFCQECNNFNWGIFSGLIVFIILYIFVLSAFTIPSASILLNYLLVVQTIAIYGYNIKYLTILPLFGLDVDYWPETCLDPNITYLLKQIISLGGMLLVIIPFSMSVRWSRDLVIKFFPHLKVFVSEFFDRNIYYSFISFLLIFYTPITYISLALVSCTKIGSSYYLSQDPSVQCFTAKHIPLFIVALLLIIVITIGVPAFIFFKIQIQKDKFFSKIFFDKYRPSFVWWDLVLLLRSILYIIVTFIFAFQYMIIKGLIISTLGLSFTFLTWLCKPFKSQYKNDMEIYLSLILCLTGIMVNTRSFTTTDLFSGIVLSLSGIGALIPIAICIDHIRSKIFPTGLQTTNPPTTKIKSKLNNSFSSSSSSQQKSINNIGENENDNLLN